MNLVLAAGRINVEVIPPGDLERAAHEGELDRVPLFDHRRPPPMMTIASGESFTVEVRGGFDGSRLPATANEVLVTVIAGLLAGLGNLFACSRSVDAPKVSRSCLDDSEWRA